ncbi:MAG TPA: cupin domain-containing protein [Acidimicrobiia bacterium]|nr:cupin domain-containing protein [Acidimicrobiia bacterium]
MVVVSVVAVALGIGGFATVSSSQQTGVSRSDLGRGNVAADYTVNGSKGTDVVVQKVTFEPGAVIPWHTHPGAETAIVASGALTIFFSDDPTCAGRQFKAGEVFLGTPVVHQAKNLGTEPVQLVITYYNVPAAGAVSTPAPRPANCTD